MIRASVVPGYSAGSSFSGEPESYLIFVTKGATVLLHQVIVNPDYVDPSSPTLLEVAESAWRKAMAERRDACDEEHEAWVELQRLRREAE